MILTASRDKTIIMWTLTRDEVGPQYCLPRREEWWDVTAPGNVFRQEMGGHAECAAKKR